MDAQRRLEARRRKRRLERKMSNQISTNDGAQSGASLPQRICSAVLFLDVDGVLNGWHTKEKCCGYTGVEQEKCERIRRIIRETDAAIVLASTWRKNPKMLPYLWENLGAEVKARHVGDTPVLEYPNDGGSMLYTARPRG